MTAGADEDTMIIIRMILIGVSDFYRLFSEVERSFFILSAYLLLTIYYSLSPPLVQRYFWQK
jgi:hypothetical protein